MGLTTILLYQNQGESTGQIGEKLGTVDIVLKGVASLNALREELRSRSYPVVLCRTALSGQPLTELLSTIQTERLGTRVILNPPSASVEDAVQAIKAGAADFIVSAGYDARVVESVLRAVAQVPDQSAGHSHPDIPVLIGNSPAMSEIRSVINLIARSQTTVLLTGESGTGKEIVAHLIHLQSNRRHHPFYALNCASLPKDVIENELFGHEKGAFTGALPRKPGCFEIAHCGTLFFDEIAEMSLETQAKLLRAIETQKFRRLGGRDEIQVNVRMVAATNKNVVAALQNKELREDLYYRLSVIELFIPPLRERKEDIPPLIDHFLAIFAGKYEKPMPQFDEEATALLAGYEWPGNVRELKNVVERAVVIAPEETITARYLPQRLSCPAPVTVSVNIPLGCSTQEAERILILQTLASSGNNKAKAARILGMSRKTLHNKLVGFSRSEE